MTSVISIKVGHFDCKHSCLVEKNVPIASILPSRWQDGAESLGIATTSCLCPYSLCTLGRPSYLKLIFAEAHVAPAQVHRRIAPALAVARRVPVDTPILAATFHAGVATSEVEVVLVTNLGLWDAPAFAGPFELVEAETSFREMSVWANLETIFDFWNGK